MTNDTHRRAKVTPEHLAEAQTLRHLWDAKRDELRARGHGTQEAFGDAFEIGNQAAVGHFLSGRTPLSLKAAIGFSRGLGVPISAFSSRLAALGESFTQVSKGNDDLAQAMSYEPADHPLLTRETVMDLGAKGDLPRRFYFELDDNAMSRDAGKGTVIVFQRVNSFKDVEPGDGVMVRTADGRLLVRYLAEAAEPGEWLAIASDRDIHRDLHSKRDGLELVALWLSVAENRLSRRRA